MQIETEKLAGRLEHVKVERVGDWTFWSGTIDGYPVIVSKTLKGMSSAAAAIATASGERPASTPACWSWVSVKPVCDRDASVTRPAADFTSVT